MEQAELLKKRINDKAKAGDLLQKLLELVRETLVATYEEKNGMIFMRIPNGQRFKILVEEVL